MPTYDWLNTPLPSARVYLDGRELPESTAAAANVEEGWVEVIEQGRRKRRHGNVVVIFLERSP